MTIEDCDAICDPAAPTFGEGWLRQRLGTDRDGDFRAALVDMRRCRINTSGDGVKLKGKDKTTRQNIEHMYFGTSGLLRGKIVGD